MKKLFLPAADLRRLDLEIHVHGLYSDDNLSSQPVCLGYVQLNNDSVFLQPKQLPDREGHPSTHILYMPLVHACEDPTLGARRVMQGQLGFQLKPCEVPNHINKLLTPPLSRLKVMIHDATNLARAVPFGFSNPYCKLYWNDDLIAKTIVENKTMNPVWREEQVSAGEERSDEPFEHPQGQPHCIFELDALR